MKKHTTYFGLIFFSAMTPLLCCCHNDGDGPVPEQPDGKPMVFAPSRADDETDDRHPLSELYNSYFKTFSVWGSYCTPTSDNRVRLFSRTISTYNVNWDNDLWVYKSTEQPALYWNAGAKDYRFYAVASNPARDVDISFVSDVWGYTLLVKDITANVIAAPEHEVLAAYDVRHVNDETTQSRGFCDEDMYKTEAYIDVPNVYDPVNLVFHHVLSVLEFRVDPESQAEHSVSQIRAKMSMGVEINTKATYNAAAMLWRYHSGLTSSLPVINRVADTDDFDQVLEIPQSVEGYSMDIEVTAATGEYKGTLPLNVGWEPGKRYIYTLSINTDEKILVDVSVEPYLNHTLIDVEEELVNW